MVERETVVPVSVQEEIWPGFSQLLEGQEKFAKEIQEATVESDLLALYKRKMELCQNGFMLYLGNIPRALAVLADLTTNNKTWKVYMEGAIMDAKAKSREVHTFIVVPR